MLLVKPLGFSISNKYLKRAGLDYWENISPETTDDLEAYLENTTQNFYFFSSKVKPLYTEIPYTPDDLLIFGSETSGLPSHFLKRWPDRFYTIPQKQGRCLNLSNCVAIVTFEAWRQLNFR